MCAMLLILKTLPPGMDLQVKPNCSIAVTLNSSYWTSWLKKSSTNYIYNDVFRLLQGLPTLIPQQDHCVLSQSQEALYSLNGYKESSDWLRTGM